MRFKFGVLFGWGIIIYAVMFLLWSLFLTYGFVEGLVPRVVGLLALLFMTIVAGRSLRAGRWHDILPYSLCWGITMVIIDAVANVPYTGWGIFADWSIWFGYAVVVAGPLLTLNPFFKNFSTPSSRV